MGHLLIIGGSDAGISAALRAREVDPALEITVALADHFPNYSICGLPFYLSGEAPDWRDLAHRSAQEIESRGIRLLLGHKVRKIHLAKMSVQMSMDKDQAVDLGFDKLVIATGAVPLRPRISGLNGPGVFFLRTMDDAFAVQAHLSALAPRSAIIVGGGYIGLEMADALSRRGLKVTVIERGPTVLSTVDAGFGELVARELCRNGVDVRTRASVCSITRDGPMLLAGGGGFDVAGGLVLVGVGAVPSASLAASAGAATGISGAIKVDRKMQTSLPNVYAAGDCVETWHAVLERATYMPLGTTAHKQGRVAGENAAGGEREFAGTLGTQVVKVFDLAIARTGLNDVEADLAGFKPLTAETTASDHKAYYPDSHQLLLRLTGDLRSGRLLGAQVVGDYRTGVAKRIDLFALAAFNRMTVDALNDIDLSYTPPLGTPWDAAQLAAQEWTRRAAEAARSN